MMIAKQWQTSLHLLLLICALGSGTSIAGAQATVIRPARMIDPGSGAVTERPTIIVSDGVIRGIGRDAAVPAGARVVELPDATILPGLIDAHTHLCTTIRPARDGASFLTMALNDPNAARAVEGVINARAMLDAGFTTVRDVGNEGNFACGAVSRAIAEQRLPGPTMITAGRIIAPFGGQFQLQPERADLVEPEYLVADTRDEMVKAIRENVHFGAGIIKIVVDDQRYLYSVDDIVFMKEEAARAGLKLAAHAWTTKGAHTAAAAGVASIEHLWAVADEDLELAKQNGVIAVFTPLLDSETRLLFPGDSTVHARQVDRIRAALRSGIPIAFGSDAPLAIPGFDRGRLAMERIDMLLEAGMTPLQLLRAMTVTPAALLGVGDRRGALRVGMAADLVAVQGDPLKEPTVLKTVSFVMKDGVVVPRR